MGLFHFSNFKWKTPKDCHLPGFSMNSFKGPQSNSIRALSANNGLMITFESKKSSNASLTFTQLSNSKSFETTQRISKSALKTTGFLITQYLLVLCFVVSKKEILGLFWFCYLHIASFCTSIRLLHKGVEHGLGEEPEFVVVDVLEVSQHFSKTFPPLFIFTNGDMNKWSPSRTRPCNASQNPPTLNFFFLIEIIFSDFLFKSFTVSMNHLSLKHLSWRIDKVIELLASTSSMWKILSSCQIQKIGCRFCNFLLPSLRKNGS